MFEVKQPPPLQFDMTHFAAKLAGQVFDDST